MRRSGTRTMKMSEFKFHNSSKKILYCKKCSNEVSVEDNVESVLCYRCTSNLVPTLQILVGDNENKRNFPKGWHLKKQFVDNDGNYFEFGVEIPANKGKFEPTPIVKKETKRKTIREKNLEEQKRVEELAKQHKKSRKERRERAQEIQKTIHEITN